MKTTQGQTKNISEASPTNKLNEMDKISRVKDNVERTEAVTWSRANQRQRTGTGE